MGKKKTPAPPHDPAQPLENTRWEKFCIAKSKGMNNKEAAKASLPAGTTSTDNSLRVTGSKLFNRPEIKVRVHWLMDKEAEKHARSEATPFTQAELLDICLEVTLALEKAFFAAEQANVPPQSLERLKTVLSAHLGRQGTLVDQETPVKSDELPADVAAMVDHMENLGICQCQL